METWFSSDYHLSHKSILNGIRGDKFSSVDEMNSTIIKNAIDAINHGDNLYLLGDLSWDYSKEFMDYFFECFRKKKINLFVINGNHDKKQFHKGVVYYDGFKDIKIQGHRLTLCHYPMLVYNASHYNAINLHGHIHKGDATHKRIIAGDCGMLYPGKRVNVNVEFWDYKPISFTQVIQLASTQENNWDYIERGIDNEV